MPLAPIKQSYRVAKPMKMLGALVFWRVEDAGVLPLKRIWRDCQAGYVRNLFNQSPPVYDTLDFIPRGTGQVFHDFRVGITNLTIVVSGNITQMAAGDSITVLIYPRGLPDQVAYSETINAVGEFQVVWTPPRRHEWIVRIRANFSQSVTPIRITGFKVERATGVGAGGGTTPSGEPAFVFVG